MKIRTGFVSNSSSSSFVCEITGEQFSGYDASLGDFELVECQNGHIFSENYVIGGFPIKPIGEDLENEDFDPNERYEISEKYCPICQMKIVSKDMLYDYSLKILGGKEKVSEDIKNVFKTYDEYKKFIKEEKNK
jgi:hypothetical protein